MGTSCSVRRATSTVSTIDMPSTARSTVFLSGMCLPPRSPSLAVTTMRQRASTIRSRSASELKPAEHDGVDGADARAGQHGVDELGHHGHVDADPVAAADAVGEEHVGDPADVVLQLAVRDVAVGAHLVLGPDDRGAVARASRGGGRRS